MTNLSHATWRFAPTGDGVLYGYNNAGTEHFKQDPIGKLVRETVQNSLDAHQDGLPPVTVDIYECDIAAEQIGATSLKPHLEQARARTTVTRQVDGQKDYRKALILVDKATIPCLAIVDRNTTGLHGRKWDSLIYEEGTPEKDGPGSPGGSFGIGKNAPYNVAALHAVIYCTRYTNGRQGRVEKMTGRTQLVSHLSPHDGVMLQHIGFYASKSNQPIVGPDIPVPFRLDETGTGIWIVGFKPERAQWQDPAVRATIDNFFYAIHNRNLIVNISPRIAAQTVTISHDTIDILLEQRKGSPRTAHYYRAIREEPIGSTKPAGFIGPMDVHINSEKGAPRRVAYVNRRGMLITDTRERRRSNPFYPGSGQGGWPDYAAVVTAKEDDTDQQMRRMENPSHDLITTERLPDGEQESAREHLNDASTQIRDIIEQAIREQDEADISNLTELAEMFPDLDPTLPGNRELTTHTSTPRPQPHRVTTVDDDSDQSEKDTDEQGDDNGTSGDGGTNGNNDDDEYGDGDGGGGGNGHHAGGTQGDEGRTRQASGKAKPHAIREMVIMRTGTGELSVALLPSSQARRRISFSIEHSGEVQWQESRLPISTINRVEPADAKVDHANGIVTVTVPKGHKGPIILTLDADQDAAYTGYGFSERQEPTDTMSTEERVTKIRALMVDGLNQSEIGKQLGISRQRVSQMVVKHKLKGGQQ